MNFTVQLVKTAVFMGDHAADIITAHEVKPGESVEDVAIRLLSEKNWMPDSIGDPKFEWYLIVRLVAPAEEKP